MAHSARALRLSLLTLPFLLLPLGGAASCGSSDSGDDTSSASPSAGGSAGQSGAAGAGQAGSGQAGAGQAGSGQAGSGQAGSGQAGSGEGGGAGGPGQAGPASAWSKTFGTKGEEAVAGLSVDGAGNIYVAGYFEDQISFGGDTLTSVDDRDGFIAKLDSSGNHLWSMRLGDKGIDVVGRAVAGPDGSVFVTGVFSTQLTLGSETFMTKGGTDMFVARLDSSGKVVWAKAFGSAKDDIARGIAVSADGKIAMVGVAAADIDVEGTKLTTKGEDGLFALFDQDGTLAVASVFGGEGGDLLQDVAFGPGGDIWIAGNYTKNADPGTGVMPWADGDKENAWVIRLDGAGKAKWARGFGGKDTDAATGVAVTASGEALFTITFQGASIDLGAGPLQSAGLYEMAYGRLDADGKPLWGQVHGSATVDGAFGCALDAQGNGFITGVYSDSVDFGSGAIDASGFVANFVLKVDPSGKALWAKDVGATSINNYLLFDSVAVDPGGGAVLAGRYDGAFDFGQGIQNSLGKGDVFLVKYAP